VEVQMENTESIKTMVKNTAASSDTGSAGEEISGGIKITDAPQGKRPLSQAERDLAVRLASASVADAVGLMMRSERHRHYSLADLEWLILPPLMLNQVMFAYSRPQVSADKAEAASKAGVTGELPPMPVAMVTWAMVSPEVAEKLEAQKKAGMPFRLAPHEWRSSDRRYVIEALGSEIASKSLLSRLPNNGR
jgi:hemolysin-activating ACP:hemolysin acyltransferase